MSSKVFERPTDIQIPATSLWAKLPLIGGVVGVAGAGFTISQMVGEHGARASFSYLFAFMTMLSIAIGALAFVLIQHLVRAGWSAVVRRVAEAAAATLPLFAVLFIPIVVLGFTHLYPWSHESDAILEAKRWWLGADLGNGSGTKFVGRAVLFFAIWSALGVMLWRLSVKQDGRDPAVVEATTHTLRKLSAGGMFLFALSMSAAAIDWQMSLLPHWYSTMYGVYYFAGAMLGFYAFLALCLLGLQKAGLLKTAVTTEHYHDVGKFMFGHTVFWAYITFCQFLLIWYANIPEETEYFMMRMEGGWDKVSLAMPFIHFFLPFFFLISRHVKRNATGLVVGAIWLLGVHVVDIYWNVLPNAGAHHGGPEKVAEGHAAGEAIAAAAAHHGPHLALALTDVTALLGIGGLFLAAFAFLLKKHPVIAIGDPRLAESMAHENY